MSIDSVYDTGVLRIRAQFRQRNRVHAKLRSHTVTDVPRSHSVCAFSLNPVASEPCPRSAGPAQVRTRAPHLDRVGSIRFTRDRT